MGIRISPLVGHFKTNGAAEAMPLTSGPTKSLNERTLIHRPLRGVVLVRFVETPHRVIRAFGRFEVKRIDTHASIKMFSGLRNPGH
jgi:hypothetical protein